ncbi:Hcp family type VI secretion system effector [Thermomonas flagellata]|uniref:Hcp family type VI secretion system effector n=1 Tax=Thermomonas flagellata TaxID=2888524 RepID=UPI001F041B4D|nr:type VI secretion system tube protein Hcp [Thermomonas flagellata]
MATDYLLEIDGIKGESKDEKHKDKIEIESFSWGCSNTGSMGRGGGGGTGKADFQDLHFTKQCDKSSPLLVKAAATGEHIKKAVLTARKAGGKGGQVEYLKVTLEDVMVSSYQTGGNAGSSSIPMDQFSLNYTKIKYEYFPQKADGSLEGAVAAQYDRALNKAS